MDKARYVLLPGAQPPLGLTCVALDVIMAVLDADGPLLIAENSARLPSLMRTNKVEARVRCSWNKSVWVFVGGSREHENGRAGDLP